MPSVIPHRFKAVDFVFHSLTENRLRTYLTISGIAVCVILFIFFNAVGAGLNDHIENRATETQLTRYSEMADILNSWLNVINITLIIILAVAVANTMLIAVSERRREIGTLKAIGFSRRQIRSLFLLEALVISTLAFFIGAVIGISAAFISDILFRQSQTAEQGLSLLFAPAEITLANIAGAALLSIAAGTLAALYPAVTASNLEPAEALRYE